MCPPLPIAFQNYCWAHLKYKIFCFHRPDQPKNKYSNNFKFDILLKKNTFMPKTCFICFFTFLNTASFIFLSFRFVNIWANSASRQWPRFVHLKMIMLVIYFKIKIIITLPEYSEQLFSQVPPHNVSFVPSHQPGMNDKLFIIFCNRYLK